MIKIDSYYTGGTIEVIKYAHQLYEHHFPAVFRHNYIEIIHWDKSYPLTAPKRRNPNFSADYTVFLACEDGDWLRLLYQLGHEYSHVAMSCFPENERLKWISECLCEAASIYVLEQSKPFFREYLPYYEKCAEEYLKNHLSKSKSMTVDEMHRYIQINMSSLSNDAIEREREGRPRNNIIGKHMANIILSNPEGWPAVAHFPTNDHNMDYREFVLGWNNMCASPPQKDFVSSIAKIVI